MNMQRTDFFGGDSGGTSFMGGDAGVPTQAIGTIPRFYMDTVIDGVASREKGHVCYTEVEMVLILFAGTNNQTVRRKVLDHDRRVYRDAYAAFRNGIEGDGPIDGTPLVEWPQINRAVAETLRMRNIRTVEELANLSDHQVMDLGMGGRQLVSSAVNYLKIRSGTADAVSMAAELAELKAQVERQQIANRNLEQQLSASERAVELAAAVAGRNVTPDQIQQSFTPGPEDEPTDPALDAMLLEANGLNPGNARAMADVQARQPEPEKDDASSRKPRTRKMKDLPRNDKPIEAK
ncbi:hypothetical protein [uncultured Pelagimonas sp.]|uniref:hypothetical protein n=1 Tax=uncultured Pelagimonas sp. TaxID=1618102 RepID=UPI00260CE5CE|nr:hypothetical protein [uncultured Pelagimonas sp.]